MSFTTNLFHGEFAESAKKGIVSRKAREARKEGQRWPGKTLVLGITLNDKSFNHSAAIWRLLHPSTGSGQAGFHRVIYPPHLISPMRREISPKSAG